jgi:ParB family transcriptional regulator, chromosome partitioning protein
MKQMKPKDIVVNPQVRKASDPQAQEELNASVKALGILQPLLVMASGALLAGHRRLIAALAAGLDTVPVIVTDRLLSDSEIRVIQLTENMHRADLTGYEKWLGCAELMSMNPQ